MLEEDSCSITANNFFENRCNFGYSIEIVYNASKNIHPIWNLVSKSSVPIVKKTIKESRNHFAYICPEGNFPTKSLTSQEIFDLKNVVIKKGFKPLIIGTSINNTNLPVDLRPNPQEKKHMARNAGYVIGVECDMLFEAAYAGIPTTLIPTGLGTDLYHAMFESMPIAK